MNDYWQHDKVIERQENEPVFLTNGCCESTLNWFDGPEVFKALNMVPGDFDGQFYPLSKAETELIAEDCVGDFHGGLQLGYSALYKGSKYLAPNYEVTFDSDKRPFSVGSYGNTLYSDAAAAEAECTRLIQHFGPKFKEIGGSVHFDPNMGDDRHCVIFLVPIEFALNLGYEAYKAWLLELTKDYQPLPTS